MSNSDESIQTITAAGRALERWHMPNPRWLTRTQALLCFVALLGCACREAPGARRRARGAAALVQPPLTQNPSAARDSVGAFARGFYAWYVPRARASNVNGVDLVLRERPLALTPDLRRALAADRARQDTVKGEIAGLDFDPFVGGQDMCAQYDVGTPVPNDVAFDVPIRGTCGGPRRTPDVVAQVVRVPGGWAFADFHYPYTGSTGLLATLRQLAADQK